MGVMSRVLWAFFFTFVTVAFSLAQNQTKVALVIGNGSYRSSTVTTLNNPPNDARDVSVRLRSIGFDVTTVINGTREEMSVAIGQFGRDLQRGDIGLFYFAGHGVQVDGTNYLIPVDAELDSVSVVPFRAIRADEILAYMEDGATDLNLFFLDACRDNPLPRMSRSLSRGLAVARRRPAETLIVYATAAGTTADDGNGRNSPFTSAFLDHVSTPGQDVYELFQNVSRDVRQATEGTQRPELFGNVTNDYNLVDSTIANIESEHDASRLPATALPAVSSSTPRRPVFQVEAVFGSIRISVATTGSVYIDGTLVGELEAGRTATVTEVETGIRSVAVRYADGRRQEESVRVDESRTVEVDFDYVERPTVSPSIETVLVTGEPFLMGSNDGNSNEEPVHFVVVDDFHIAKTETTFDQYQEYVLDTMGRLPDDEGWGRGNRPVMNVSWYDAVRYCNWLSDQDGLTPAYIIDGENVDWLNSANGWRVPTEAEWEYAARGGADGSQTKFAGGDDLDPVGWYTNNSHGRTEPVAQKQANELGIYDMSGNVQEWCWDRYGSYSENSEKNPTGPESGRYRTMRGGDFADTSRRTVTYRLRDEPDERSSRTGFRIARNASTR